MVSITLASNKCSINVVSSIIIPQLIFGDRTIPTSMQALASGSTAILTVAPSSTRISLHCAFHLITGRVLVENGGNEDYTTGGAKG
jgi:hypothetical protein